MDAQKNKANGAGERTQSQQVTLSGLGIGAFCYALDAGISHEGAGL